MSMNDVAKFVVITGWIGMLIACFTILGAVAYTEMIGLASTAFGFLCGSLPTMVKEIITKPGST